MLFALLEFCPSPSRRSMVTSLLFGVLVTKPVKPPPPSCRDTGEERSSWSLFEAPYFQPTESRGSLPYATPVIVKLAEKSLIYCCMPEGCQLGVVTNCCRFACTNPLECHCCLLPTPCRTKAQAFLVVVLPLPWRL